jgi:hypothetical protein
MTAPAPDGSLTCFRFTTTSIGRIICPAGRAAALHWDVSLPGFGVVARPNGRRSWIVQYRIGRQSKRVTVGDRGESAGEGPRNRRHG